MKHTPGPWKRETRMRPIQTHGVPVVAEDGSGIAWVMGGESEQCKANATLIATAPRMLDALKYVVQWHREHDEGDGAVFGQDFVTACIAAVHEAEGRF